MTTAKDIVLAIGALLIVKPDWPTKDVEVDSVGYNRDGSCDIELSSGETFRLSVQALEPTVIDVEPASS